MPMPRRQHKRQLPIVWLTGNSGSGKTTLATMLRDQLEEAGITHKILLLDGDELRRTISIDDDLSPAGRRNHNLRVARLARLLQEQGCLVIVAVIAPFAAVREEIDMLCAPLWVYIHRTMAASPEKPYEAPASPDYLIDHDRFSCAQSAETLSQALLQRLGPHLAEKNEYFARHALS